MCLVAGRRCCAAATGVAGACPAAQLPALTHVVPRRIGTSFDWSIAVHGEHLSPGIKHRTVRLRSSPCWVHMQPHLGSQSCIIILHIAVLPNKSSLHALWR